MTANTEFGTMDRRRRCSRNEGSSFRFHGNHPPNFLPLAPTVVATSSLTRRVAPTYACSRDKSGPWATRCGTFTSTSPASSSSCSPGGTCSTRWSSAGSSSFLPTPRSRRHQVWRPLTRRRTSTVRLSPRSSAPTTSTPTQAIGAGHWQISHAAYTRGVILDKDGC